MEPIVEIVEYPDYEAYRRVYYFLNVRNPAAWFNWIAAYAFVPGCTTFLIVTNLIQGKLAIQTFFFIASSIALFIYEITKPRRAFKRKSPSFITCSTAFFEDHYAFVTTGQNSTNAGSHGYDHVKKAYETTSAFYLKKADKSWHFLPKKFFAPGQVEILRNLFARKFGDKFVSKI